MSRPGEDLLVPDDDSAELTDVLYDADADERQLDASEDDLASIKQLIDLGYGEDIIDELLAEVDEFDLSNSGDDIATRQETVKMLLREKFGPLAIRGILQLTRGIVGHDIESIRSHAESEEREALMINDVWTKEELAVLSKEIDELRTTSPDKNLTLAEIAQIVSKRRGLGPEDTQLMLYRVWYMILRAKRATGDQQPDS